MSEKSTKNGSQGAKDKALQSALDQITKDFGSEAVQVPGEHNKRKRVEGIPTGSLSLDIALGIGGIAVGRIIEVYGPESSGKTTLCYHLIAEAQKMGETCAFIDAEHAMDPQYAERIGVNFEKLLVSQPDYGEQALEIADKLVASGALKMVVIDSVAALTPKSELEGAMGDQSIGLQARMMSQAMRKIAGHANTTGTTVVFINQIREKIGVMFGSPETQPGGRALKFFSSQRLDIRRIGSVKDGSEIVANEVRVKVVKNKVAPPYRQAEFELTFGEGIDTMGELLNYATDSDTVVPGIISKNSSFFTFEDTGEKMQGRPKAKEYMRQHPEIAEKIYSGVAAHYMPSEEEIEVAEAAEEPEAEPIDLELAAS